MSPVGHPRRSGAPPLTGLKSPRARLVTALLAACTVAVVTPSLGPTIRLLLSFNVGVWTLIGLAWGMILTADAKKTRTRAAAEDAGRLFVHVAVLLSTIVTLLAAVLTLRQRASLHSAVGELWLPIWLAAVAGAWLLNHTSWTLHYAHLYYRDGDAVGGLEFPGRQPPDDMDFAYFAFTIGMCAQTSDVVVTSQRIRRSVLFHSVQSFAFNTTVIALMLNVVYGLLTT